MKGLDMFTSLIDNRFGFTGYDELEKGVWELYFKEFPRNWLTSLHPIFLYGYSEAGHSKMADLWLFLYHDSILFFNAPPGRQFHDDEGRRRQISRVYGCTLDYWDRMNEYFENRPSDVPVNELISSVIKDTCTDLTDELLTGFYGLDNAEESEEEVISFIGLLLRLYHSGTDFFSVEKEDELPEEIEWKDEKIFKPPRINFQKGSITASGWGIIDACMSGRKIIDYEFKMNRDGFELIETLIGSTIYLIE
jgi:hypothetical protein